MGETKEKSALTLLVRKKGTMPYPDFLVESGIDATTRNQSHATQLFYGLKQRITPKLAASGWSLRRKGNSVELKRVKREPKQIKKKSRKSSSR